MIAAERDRQISDEGYDAEHDRGHAVQLVSAGNAYAAFAYVTIATGRTPEKALAHGAELIPSFWPWPVRYWKPTGDPVRDLTKAGALIAAAIDATIATRNEETPR